jgi:hypothetical protein
MAHGKWAAEEIDQELVPLAKGEKNRFDRLFRKFTYENKVPVKPEGGCQSVVAELPVKTRIGNFEEVSKGLTSQKALNEALRCLRCDVKEQGGL